jgi:hypothetical protein
MQQAGARGRVPQGRGSAENAANLPRAPEPNGTLLARTTAKALGCQVLGSRLSSFASSAPLRGCSFACHLVLRWMFGVGCWMLLESLFFKICVRRCSQALTTQFLRNEPKHDLWKHYSHSSLRSFSTFQRLKTNPNHVSACQLFSFCLGVSRFSAFPLQNSCRFVEFVSALAKPRFGPSQFPLFPLIRLNPTKSGYTN